VDLIAKVTKEIFPKRKKEEEGGINHSSSDFVGLGDMLKLKGVAFKEGSINSKKYNRSMTSSLCELWIFDLIILYPLLRNHCNKLGVA